jgi:hypothetical protein
LRSSLAEWRSFSCNQGGNIAFGAMYHRESFVPAPLQLARHEAIGWIDGVVLPTGVSRLITRGAIKGTVT